MQYSPFLREVAADLLERWGRDGLRNAQVVFPSVRAKQHFVHHLAGLLGGTSWLPAWGDMRTIMECVSGLRVVKPITLMPHLYRLYAQHLHWEEPFADFYRWGEVLMGDFDQLDKYRVNAEALFQNLANVRTIDSRFDYLDEESRALLREFFGLFDEEHPADGSLRKRYLALWRALSPIYQGLRRVMDERGEGYEGYAYRLAADRMEANPADLQLLGGVATRVAFVGFNALNACEHVLFSTAMHHHEALFYWNYSQLMVEDPNEEAGLFIRDNLRRYPSALPGVPAEMCRRARVEVNSVPSALAQAEVVHNALVEMQRDGGLRSTALVLADETMLTPVLRALPESVAQCNVTMGYPLRGTLVYTFVELLLDCFSSLDAGEGSMSVAAARELTQHPYFARVEGSADFATLIEQCHERRMRIPFSSLAEGFSHMWGVAMGGDLLEAIREGVLMLGQALASTEEQCEEDQLALEYVLASEQVISEMYEALAEGHITPTGPLLEQLLPQAFHEATAPFIGEPLEGLQLIGFLETRALDFERVIIVSCNEGFLPRNGRRASFLIPSMMHAFGMPTQREHEAIYAYYFQAVSQRAKVVSLIYVENASMGAGGEPSRYILQRMYDADHPLAQRTVYAFNPLLRSVQWGAVRKEGPMREQLAKYLGEAGKPVPLSPHAIGLYVTCPLAFFFRYLACLKTREEDAGVEPSALALGQVMHNTLQDLYLPWVQKPWGADALREMEGRAHSVLLSRYTRELRGEEADEASLSGIERIGLSVLQEYLRTFFAVEKLRADSVAEVASLEKGLERTFSLSDGRCVQLGGRVDRVDKGVDNSLVVLDYKTGKADEGQYRFSDLSELFTRGNSRQGYLLQVFLYCHMVLPEAQAQGAAVVPALWFLRDTASGHLPCVQVHSGNRGQYDRVMDFRGYDEAFAELLRAQLDTLFDFSVPFEGNYEPARCRACEYARLCGLRG